MKLGQLLWRAQVGFAGYQYVANADLVFIQGLLRVIGINELARIDNGKDGADFQHTVERLGFQFVDNAGGVRQAAGFNHQAVGFGIAQHFLYGRTHLRTGSTAQTAAGDFCHGDAVVAQDGAVNADFAKFVDDDDPFFIRVFLRHQTFKGGGFACSEEA